MYLNPQIHGTQDTLTIHVGYIGIHRDTFKDTYLEPYLLRPRLDARWDGAWGGFFGAFGALLVDLAPLPPLCFLATWVGALLILLEIHRDTFDYLDAH